MYITVVDDYNETIYEGDAEEFLEINQYEADLVDVLNKLDESQDTTMMYCGNFTDVFYISKIRP